MNDDSENSIPGARGRHSRGQINIQADMTSETKTGMTRREREKQAYRERERQAHIDEILTAAEASFLEHGFHNATMEDIARRADFAVGSIYTFFKNKEDLVNNVLLRIANLRLKDVEENVMPVINKPWDAIRALTCAWYSEHINHGDFIRISRAMRMSAGHGGGINDIKDNPPPEDIRRAVDKYHEYVMRVFDNAKRLRAVKEMPTHNLMLVFDGIAHAYVFHKRASGNVPNVQTAVSDLLEIYRTILTPGKEC